MIKLIKISYNPASFGEVTETRNIRQATGQFFTGADGVEWCVAPSRFGYPQLFFKNPSDGSFIHAAEVRLGLDDWRTKATLAMDAPDGTPWKQKINATLRNFFGNGTGQY